MKPVPWGHAPLTTAHRGRRASHTGRGRLWSRVQCGRWHVDVNSQRPPRAVRLEWWPRPSPQIPRHTYETHARSALTLRPRPGPEMRLRSWCWGSDVKLRVSARQPAGSKLWSWLPGVVITGGSGETRGVSPADSGHAPCKGVSLAAGGHGSGHGSGHIPGQRLSDGLQPLPNSQPH